MTDLGYFLSDSMEPFDALLPILDNIIAIDAEDWSLRRVPIPYYQPQPGDLPADAYTDEWCGKSESDEIAINPGEMVEVRYIGTQPAEFKLGGENPNPPFTESYYRKMAAHFDYEEQPGYIPIFITIDLNEFGDEKPLELAVYVDDICKGAAIIKEGQVQLNAYILNDQTIEMKDLEFRMYFPGKATSSKVSNYSVRNFKNGRYESKTVTVAECQDFIQITIEAIEEIPLPACTALKSNFPNPFNPETTISYDMAKSGRARLEVFNVKGQAVKTLVNGHVEAGTHFINWNGRNEAGNNVSSGIYFYRLTANGKTLTNKMMLMK
jgi:hypothetical protein